MLTSVFLTLSANISFFDQLGKIYPPGEGHLLFLISVWVLLFGILTLVITLFAAAFPIRAVLAVFLTVAAAAGFYMDKFGTVIDTGMIENIVQTDLAEIRDLISLPFILRIGLLGIGLSAVLWLIPIRQTGKLLQLRQHAVTAVISLAIVIAVVFSFSDQYAGFFRQHKLVRFYTNPITPIYFAIRYASDQLHSANMTPGAIATTAADAHITAAHNGPKLIIMVVGETARRDRFSLNGYSRKTNPLLEQEPRIVSYSNISSCGTSTSVSVPCMFSKRHRDDFSTETAGREENVLDVLQRVGVNVLWRDNNSSSKGVADRVLFQDFRHADMNPACDTECRDIGLLEGLQDYINQQPGDILIVLHQMGNHGPAYFKRYPPEFARFTPACRSLDIADCTDEELDNAYDNAILYTDYFLSQVIALLKANTPHYQTAMLYVSDHGESLDEYGLYLHGAPYMMAPDQQTQVPVILWAGESADIDLEATRAADKDKKNSHDAIFPSLLAAFNVESADVDPDILLFAMKPD